MAHVYVRSGAGGAGTGADWANAYTTLGAALTAKAAGDSFWVSEDHAETAGSAKTLTSPGTAANPCFIYCVDHAGTVPPVSADLRTTATVTTTGNFGITLAGGRAYCYGITFNAGSGANGQPLSVATGNSWWSLENCALNKLGTSGNSSAILFGASSSNITSRVDLKNTTLQFGSIADGCAMGVVNFSWKNTSSAIQGATLPTTLFSTGGAMGGNALLEGIDLSALGSGKTLVAGVSTPRKYIFKDCKLGASVTIAVTPGDPGGAEVYVVRSDSDGTNYRSEKYQFMGTQVIETTIIRTGGAKDGVTGLSWNLTTTANSRWVLPFEALPIAIKNAVTGSNIGVTLEGIWNAAALPNNDEFWLDVEYLGDASSPQGSFKPGSKSDNLATGSALTASTQAWDSLVTARANSTTYAVGNVRKVASNPGRIFFVIAQSSASASSEPGGFATAVDGGSVTDGGVTWRAAVRFKQTLTLSSPQPAQKGYIYIYPKAAKASSTFYICPKVALS